MAKQIGHIKLEGTIDGVTYYQMQGEYFARMKSSLNKDRFLRDPAFAGSRLSAEQLGQAAKIASKLYRLLDIRSRDLFNEIVGQVKHRIKFQWNEAAITRWFHKVVLEEPLKRGKGCLSLSGLEGFRFEKPKSDLQYVGKPRRWRKRGGYVVDPENPKAPPKWVEEVIEYALDKVQYLGCKDTAEEQSVLQDATA